MQELRQVYGHLERGTRDEGEGQTEKEKEDIHIKALDQSTFTGLAAELVFLTYMEKKKKIEVPGQFISDQFALLRLERHEGVQHSMNTR